MASSRESSIPRRYILVVSIDIGTTYSCCGFSFSYEFERSPLQGMTITGITPKGYRYGKRPSSLLLNENKEFSEFGWEAEEKYGDLVDDDEHHGWYLFRGFKRKLQDNMTDDYNFMLISENGKTLSATLVYTAAIRYFKNLVENAISSGTCLREGDIKWVIAVPAVWSENARAFIRQSGVQAGIPPEDLELVLEPEAATLFAKYSIQVDKSMKSNSDDHPLYFNKGFKCLVCDAGGGTADISVCESMDDGQIRELYVSSGEDWCCTLVFEKFCNILGEKIGEDILKDWQTSADDFNGFQEEFNLTLDNFLTRKSPSLSVRLPYSLLERIPKDTFSKLKAKSSNVYFRTESLLTIKAECIYRLFEHPIYKLCGYIRKAISHPNSSGINLMIIVGGFSEYCNLKECLQKEFPGIEIYIPTEGSLAVVKGSLIYGHNPSIISQRIANFTYGCVPIFELEDDEEFFSFSTDETPLCNGPFDSFVEIGTPLLIGEPQVIRTYQKTSETKSVSFYLYGSTKRNPKDVSDKSCFYLGNITMKYEKLERVEGTVQLEVQFGGSIIKITLKDLTSHRSEDVIISASLRLKTDDYLFVAAIDLGTTYSGYAFSSRHNHKENPTEIITRTWDASSGKLQSLKTSTCVLFDPTKRFHSFGFDAEDKFMQLASEGKHEGWFFFRRFKMKLYSEKTLDGNLHIMSESGDSLPALTVFSAVIRYLKNKMMKELLTKNLNVHDFGLRWVITVPAIWTDSSKLFMRRCAIKAGIAEERLTIALEPEAAAIYTNFSSIRRSFPSSSISCGKGDKYLVCDAGGGTVDITVHEMIDDEGHVRELHKASGGDWGGTKVDEEVRKFYEKVVGTNVMEKFKKENLEGALEMARDFEMKKRAFNPKSKENVQLKLPNSLQRIYKGFNGRLLNKDILQNNAINDDVKIIRDKLIVSSKMFESFFTPSLSSICNHIKKILEHPNANGVDLILLVGGYAESDILRSVLKESFPAKEIKIPKEPGLSVLKGAVIFGHEPELIQERKAKYTYGIECSTVFCKGKHREDYKTEVDGVMFCRKIFDRHVKIGSTLTVGKYQSTRTYSKPANAQAANVVVYASSQENPKYVTDEGCFCLGSKTLEFEGGKTRGASVIEAQMSFSGTEIELTLTCKTTGRITKVHLENK